MSHAKPADLKHPSVLVATFGGSGLLRPAPGTWGTLAALVPAWVIATQYSPQILLYVAMALFFIGCWASDAYMVRYGAHDPGEIVVDEAAGVMLALSFTEPLWWTFALGFIFFRLFDILKPWPISLADRKIDGGLGVMVDDIIAGAFAALALQLAYIAITVTYAG